MRWTLGAFAKRRWHRLECQGKEARVRVDLGRGLDDGQMRGVPTSLCLLEFVNKRVGKGEEKMRSEKEKEEE
jgi:hypothetical protein